MPKLLLKFHAAVVKEIPIAETPLTIGRKADNDIVVDAPGISDHHARIVRAGGAYVIEDLQSTNGTFLNAKRVSSAALRDRDEIGIGQHTLSFAGSEPRSKPLAEPQPSVTPATPTASTPRFPLLKEEPAGLLRVLEGKSELPEYPLNVPLTYIGKSETAAVRISGLFAPDIAALISKRPTGFLFTAVKEGYPRLNGKPQMGQSELKDGDIIETGKMKFVFQLAGSPEKD